MRGKILTDHQLSVRIDCGDGFARLLCMGLCYGKPQHCRAAGCLQRIKAIEKPLCYSRDELWNGLGKSARILKKEL